MLVTSHQVRRSVWGRVWPPRVIAERSRIHGASGWSLRADAVALDVMRCGSGELVVFHEHTLAGFGGGRWDDVAQTPYATLKTIDLGGGRIPLFAEALAAIVEHVPVTIRLRFAPTDGEHERAALAANAFAIASQLGAADRVLFGAVDGRALEAIDADVETALLIHGSPLHTPRPPRRQPAVVELELPCADAAEVRRWQARGTAVHLWPANTASQLAVAWSLRVDGVITTDPAFARRTLDRLGRIAS